MTSENHENRKLRTRTPKLSVSLATTLARDLYGLHVQSCQELDSFIDRNYHLTVDAGNVCNQHVGQVCAHGFVLKILNSKDSKKSYARTETAVIQHVYNKTTKGQGFCTPRVVPTVHGFHFAMCSLDSDTDSYKIVVDSAVEQHAIRLLEYVPGSSMATIPVSPRLAFQLGHCAAALDTILQDFDDSNYQVLGDSDWALVNLPSLRHVIDTMKDSALRCLTSDIVDKFEGELLKSDVRETFKRGYIHGDLTLHNILVSRIGNTECLPPGSSSSTTITPSDTAQVSSSSSSSSSVPLPASSDWNVTGIVDFGDIAKSYLILEVVNSMCDAMIRCPVGRDPDALAGHILAGYLSQMALSRKEVEMLPLTICARMAQTVIVTHQVLMKDPHNQYVSDFCASLERELPRFWKVPIDLTLTLWQDIVENCDVEFPTY